LRTNSEEKHQQRFLPVVLLAVLIIVIFFGIMWASQSRISWTVDEQRWIQFGDRVMENGWTDHPDEISHPVLFVMSHSLLRHYFAGPEQDSIVGVSRLAMYPYILIGLVVLFIWALRRHGTIGSLVALSMLAFCPTFLAHARLVTTDGMVSSAILLSAFALARHLKRPTIPNGILLSVAFAFGMLSKFSFLLIPIVFLGMTLVWNGEFKRGALNRAAFVRMLKKTVLVWLVPFLAAIILVNAIYGFEGMFPNINNFELESPCFQRFADSPFSILPIPLPARYLKGMNVHLSFANAWPAFLFGTVSHKGFAGYDIIAFLIKTSVPALLLIVIGLAGIWKHRLAFDEKIALATALIWLLYFSFIHRIDCGIRYILPFYPLIFFLGARMVNYRLFKRFNGKHLGIILVMCQLGVATMHFPFYIPFFNCLAGGTANGHLILGDSNLSWTQELKALRQYQEKNHINEITFGMERRLMLLKPYIDYQTITLREKYFPSTGCYAIWIATLQQLLHQGADEYPGSS